MADSFVYYRPHDSGPRKPDRPRVLVTGAAGTIGRVFVEQTHKRYDLRLGVHKHDDDSRAIEKFGEIVVADVTDLHAMRRACEGVDTVLHLAGNPNAEAAWESLQKVNIAGTYNTMVAAKAAGCRRFIFASSIHAVSGYPADRQVMSDSPVNPGDLYGVSKCFGEAMGRYMAEQEGLSVIAVRICAFQPREAARGDGGLWMLDAYISPRDMTQLFCKAIDNTTLRFAIVHGISDNRFKRLDLTETRELLGFEPQDDLTEINTRLSKLKLDEKVTAHDQGDPGKKSGIREEIEKLRDMRDEE